MTNVIDIFMQIVQIDSVTSEEEKMAQFLMNFLKNECGFEPSIDEYNNVFVQTKGVGEPLFINAHMDTVEPGRGIVPVLKDGLLTSKGNTILGADDKGAVSAIMSALLHTTSNDGENGEKTGSQWRPLDILFTTSEEVGNYGAIGFDKSKIRAKTGIIFDGSGPVETIMAASPFYARFDVVIKGVAAHAGYPENSNPAVPVMLELVSKLESLRKDKLLINVGKIIGGNARNTIIGEITLNGEIRSYYKEIFEEALSDLNEIFSAEYSCELITDVKVENPGYVHSDENLAEMKKLIDMHLSTDTQIKWSYGVSDANIFNEDTSKLKVFNLGDGSTGAHTTEESVTVEALERMRELILKFAAG